MGKGVRVIGEMKWEGKEVKRRRKRMHGGTDGNLNEGMVQKKR